MESLNLHQMSQGVSHTGKGSFEIWFFLILTCHCKANIGHCLGVKGSRFTQILANTYTCGFGDTQRNLKVKMESSNEKFLTAVTDG